MRLVGRTAVVTGASRGLGRAIAARYLAEGASVVCGARTPGDDVEMGDAGDRLRFRRVDVTEPSSVTDLMQYAADTFGHIDVLVSNAGVSRDGRVERLSPKEWDEMVATNLTGVFLCTREVVPHMTATGGRIINLSSCMASRAAVGAAGYCATKAAVEMFTKVCAIELAGKGILVNCLAPGVIDEGMGHELAATNGRVWDTYRKRFALGRPGQADEVSDAAVFLASAESSYVNGSVLEVNGGLLWA